MFLGLAPSWDSLRVFLDKNDTSVFTFAKRIKVTLNFQAFSTTNVPALYCLIDAASETISWSLQSVGDRRRPLLLDLLHRLVSHSADCFKVGPEPRPSACCDVGFVGTDPYSAAKGI